MALLEPLRVRAWLRTPVVCEPSLPLDGILHYQALRERYGAESATVPGGVLGRPENSAPLLPLAVCADGGDPYWYYASSWAQWPEDADGQDTWNKRLATTHIGLLAETGRPMRVQIKRGCYRAYHMPIFYRSALYVEWYCRGDVEQIGALLAPVMHIGKKRSQGWGRVVRWEIERQAEDWSVWQAGRLMRTLPILAASDLSQAQAWYGIRPPYYEAANQSLVWMPNDDISPQS